MDSKKIKWSRQHLQMREGLAEKLEANGFPSSKNEDWKYTNIRRLVDESHHRAPLPVESNASIELDSLLRDLASEQNILVFNSGHFLPEISRLESKIKCEFFPFKHILSDEKYSKKAQELTQDLDDFEQTGSALTWLNGLLFEDGMVLHVPDNIQIENPIYLIHFSQELDQSYASFLRHHVVLGQSSQLTLNFIHSGTSEAKYFANVVTQIRQKPFSQLNIRQIQNEPDSSFHFHQCKVNLEQNSRLNSLALILGGLQSRHEMSTHVSGEEAIIKLDGISLAKNSQQHDLRTDIQHFKSGSQSHQLFKSIAADKSRIVFNGKIKIASNAQKINSSQMSKSILLSNQAEIDTQPVLEIHADDVKATHGASIGQIDPEQIFYLQTRGLSRAKAQSLLAQAFIKEVFDKHDISCRLDSLIENSVPHWLDKHFINSQKVLEHLL